MRRPVSINSLEGLRAWCYNLADEEAKHCFQLGKENWDSTIWQNAEQGWEDVAVEELARKIKNGLSLFLEEVEKCYNSNGGPYLEQFRKGNSPYRIPSPAWGEEPIFPIADKLRNFGMRSWSKDEAINWRKNGQPVAWDEAWEIARPWVKDPRVHQPQRLFHPGGWAAGELDLVLRWDGNIRLIDIKSGNPSSKFAESLKHQLNFYAWLWHETHENQIVDGIEGWYLDNPSRIQYEVPSNLEMTNLGQKYKKIHREMLNLGEGPVKFPNDYPEPCRNSAGCFWCSFGEQDQEQESNFLNNLVQL